MLIKNFYGICHGTEMLIQILNRCETASDERVIGEYYISNNTLNRGIFAIQKGNLRGAEACKFGKLCLNVFRE